MTKSILFSMPIPKTPVAYDEMNAVVFNSTMIGGMRPHK